MTDAPDETTSPDATSDTGAQPHDGTSSGVSSTGDGPTGTATATGAADAAVDVPAAPRAPKPGQRVPRRATAPSPRTAPAVVVAPTPPRVKASPIVASTARPATAPGSDPDAGEAASTPSRPPRVRRRTRAQRAAGDPADAGTPPQPDAEQDGPPVLPSEPAAPSEPEQDDLDALSGMLADVHRETPSTEADPVRETRDVDPSPESTDTDEVASEGEQVVAIVAEPGPDPIDAADEERGSGSTRDDGMASEPDGEPADESSADAEEEADAEVEEEAAPAPAAVATPPRAVSVRTDSLTSPRSTRAGLPGVGETALTPSVRGDRAAAPALGDDVLVIEGLTKRFDEKVAVDDVALTVRAGSFYGIVGPNGAGKTTTMSMVTGLLRPDAGTVTVNGIDVWQDPLTAKRSIGVLPDRLRLFDRLTGAQLLHYSGALRGLDDAEIRSRSADLIQAFGLEDAVGRLVTDYSAGMTKKVALACAMIHSPRMLVLDEPFESVDPVSAANVVEILQDYVAHGGTVVLSSHGMDFIQRICDHVAIIVNGRVLAAGTMDEVRAGRSLEERFVALAGGRRTAEGFSWLHSFSD
ncbi:ATP-binding cassette domain-containing protein [Clavibacter zhangzhiyongii]|uniref:ATP-binding cassette domain-containing protein n=1 Tax=Clavibacter zhangzhiyongii TaxID=2768071 RepID=UPI0039DF934F